MLRRYLILGLFIITLVVPATPMNGAAANLFEDSTMPSIGVQLKMELSRDAAVQESHRTILQFDQQLTPQQIQFAESVGIEFVRRADSIVNVGRILP